MKVPRPHAGFRNSKRRAPADKSELARNSERIAESAESTTPTDRVLQRLSEGATRGEFVHDLQREMIELLGGRCSAQFRVHENVLSGGVIFADGIFVSDDSFFGIRDSDVPSWSKIVSSRLPTVFTLPNDSEMIHELTLQFMKERHFNWLVNFPLFVSGKPAWILAVLGDDPNKLTEANLDRFATLGRQLTLALQLNHLHEEAARNELARTIAEERTRLARDIHDTLAQGFAAICMRLQAAQREPDYTQAPQAVRNQIAASLNISSSHLVHARRSIHSLREENDEHLRLDEALQLTLAQMASHIPLVSRVQFPATPVPKDRARTSPDHAGSAHQRGEAFRGIEDPVQRYPCRRRWYKDSHLRQWPRLQF